MRSTLFHIPAQIGSGAAAVPMFGWGILLAIWGVVAAGMLARAAARDGIQGAVSRLGVPLAAAGGMILWGLPALDDGHGVPVRGFGVMLLAAVAAGAWLSIHRGRSHGFDADTILALGLEVVIWGLVGARLFYVVEYHELFFPPGRSLAVSLGQVLNLAAGGLVVFGALPTAAVAAWLFARRRGISILQLADCVAPGLLVGLAIGRLGCFLNGCCFGGPCDLPWAVRFPPDSPPWIDQQARGLLPPSLPGQPVPWTLPIHPAQLYASVDAGLLALLAMAFTPLARRVGSVFALVLTLHPLSRMLLEAIRVDEPPALGTPFSISQLVSLGLLALAGVLWRWVLRHPVPPAAAEDRR